MDDTAQNQNAPVGTPKKEQEPVGPSYIEKVERQPEVPPEVAQVGVTPVTGPTLTDEDRKVGIEEAKEEVPVATKPEGIVSLPLTEQEAKKTLRVNKNITDAIVWLANFVLRQFKILKMKGKYAD